MRISSWIIAGVAFGLTGIAHAGPIEACAKAGNDDTVRPYVASLRPGFLRAYKKLFPSAKGGPVEGELSEGSVYRCAHGHLLACFVGANLPCAKIDTSRQNRGAVTFCRDNPGAPNVPLAASGHDGLYNYRCVGSQARVSGTAWSLDAGGFAKRLWAPLD